MPFLRDSEFYVLWVKVIPDSSWHISSALHINAITSADSTIIFGKFRMVSSLDSIYDGLITLEETSTPSSPGLPIARCGKLQIDSSKKYVRSTLDANQFVGDFTSLQ